MLLAGSSLPAFGQTTTEAKPSSEPADTQPADQPDYTYRFVVKAIGASEKEAMSEEEVRKAIDRFTERLNQKPNDIESLVARAGARMMLGEIKEAQADLTVAIKIAPNNSTAWYVYAQTKIGLDADTPAVKEGIAALKKAHDLGFDDPELFCMLGVAWHKTGDTRRAIANFSKAIDKNVAKAYFPRAMLRSETGDTLLAIADFDKVIELGAAARVASSFAFCERGRAHQTAGHVQEAINDYSKAIEEASKSEPSPISAMAYLGRATAYDATGNWQAALRDYTRGVELEPNHPEYVAYRGCAYITHGQVKEGVADIRKAIELNPGDLGANYRPLTDKTLDPEAFAHGEKQVRKMLKDRPLMAKHVAPGDALWTWAVRKFAGEDLGQLIDWDADPPTVSSAETKPAKGSEHAFIRIAERQPGGDDESSQFEKLWTCAVFELNNSAASAEFLRLDQQVRQGNLTCEQYVEACLNSEQPASQRTRAFYLNYYLNWMQQHGSLKTDPREWHCDAFRGQSELARIWQWPHPRYFSFNYYAICIERELERGNQKEAKEALAELLKFADVSEETKRFSKYCSGHVNLATGNFKDATADFSAAISGNERDISSIWGRAAAYSNQGEHEKALADFNRVIDLDPENVEALSDRALELLTLDRENDAIADLNKAMLIEPRNGELYLRRAWAKGNLFDAEGSIEDFSKSIDLAPQNPQAFQGRGKMFARRGERDKALTDYGTAIKLNPKDDELLCERGWVHFLNNDPRRAVDDFSAAIKLMPNSSVAYANRAEAVIRTNDPKLGSAEDAMKDAKRACELCESKSAYELTVLAQAYLMLGDFDNAVKWQETAVSLSNGVEKEEYVKDLENIKQRQKERK
jgi:tetratricopeptide (TPR) repeat protein